MSTSKPSQTESVLVQIFTFPDGMCLLPNCPKRKISMSKRSQREYVYVQAVPDLTCICQGRPRRSFYVHCVPDGKYLCPRLPRRQVSMSKPSQMENVFVPIVHVGQFLCPKHPNGKFICPKSMARNFFVQTVPDRKCQRKRCPIRKFFTSTPSQMESVYV